MTLATSALRLVRAGSPVAALYVGKLIVDEVLALAPAASGAASFGAFADVFVSERAARLWLFVGLEFGVAAASDVLNRGIALLDSLLGDLFTNETSARLMRHAALLDLEMFEDSTFYDKLEKARRQTTSRISLMTQTLAQAQDAVSMVALATALAVFSPWLLALALCAVIPAFMAETRFNQKSYSLMNSWTPRRRELDYLRYIGASDETAKEVKMFGLAEYLAGRYETLSRQYYEENRALATRRAFWGAALATLGALGYYAAYSVIIAQTLLGALSLGDMTFLAGSFRSLRQTLEAALGRFASIAEGAMYLQDLFDFFALQPRIAALPASSVGGKRLSAPIPRPIREGVRFENVGFRYVNSERWALRNVSFELRAGEKLALVGENGAGKTTLVKLLARLYDPVEGRILLDGKDLREYDADALRAEIGVIFQDFIRYQMQVSVNIAVGRIEERENRERIETAAAQSLADTVIRRLPEGYEQTVGRYFQKGVDLSGGEWQKLALARAYMREAQVLILDEPTAALDARAEHEVFERFAELTTGKTAVLISHRFSTVRMADRILVLEAGTPLEIGSHDELVASGGRYAELFALQRKGYL